MQTLKSGQIKLYPPREMWRRLCEKKITVTDCMVELRLKKVKVSRRAVQNWFNAPDGEITGKWLAVESVLARMCGK